MILTHTLDSCHYDYILTKYEPQRPLNKNDLPSSIIFEWAASYKTIFEAQKSQNFFGVNKTVYGITQNTEYLDYELYYYYPLLHSKHTLSSILNFLSNTQPTNFIPSKNHYLTSFKINSSNKSKDIDVYVTDLSCVDKHRDHIISGYGEYAYCKICRSAKKISLYSNKQENSYSFFEKKNDANIFVQQLSVKMWNKTLSLDNVIDSDLLKSKRSGMICISAKPDNTMGIYFSRINIYDTVLFLKKNNFNMKILNKIEKNINRFTHLLFDVGYNIKYETENGLVIKKKGFYGIL